MKKGRAERLEHLPHTEGRCNMEVSEVISLLTLLAVVIFGIIDLMEKK